MKSSHETKRKKIMFFFLPHSPPTKLFFLPLSINTDSNYNTWLTPPISLIISYVVNLCIYKKVSGSFKVKGTHNLCSLPLAQLLSTISKTEMNAQLKAMTGLLCNKSANVGPINSTCPLRRLVLIPWKRNP